MGLRPRILCMWASFLSPFPRADPPSERQRWVLWSVVLCELQDQGYQRGLMDADRPEMGLDVFWMWTTDGWVWEGVYSKVS